MSYNCLYAKELPAGRPTIRETILEKGCNAVSDIELVAAIIGNGTKQNSVISIAKKILEILDTSKGNPELTAITAIQGIGLAQSCRILAAYELGKRLFGIAQKKITGPCDIWDAIKHLADRNREQFICCTLNGAQALIQVHIISIGIINRTIVHPREVYVTALNDRACSIIIAHNHPSGRLEASPDDIEITKNIFSVGEILNIPLLDHIIFTYSGYISLKEQGIIGHHSTLK